MREEALMDFKVGSDMTKVVCSASGRKEREGGRTEGVRRPSGDFELLRLPGS